MNLRARWCAVAGALALLGLALWLGRPSQPSKEDTPLETAATVARVQYVRVDPSRVEPHDHIRTLAASHDTSSSGSTPTKPCRASTDAEGNTEADCSAPLALDSPFR